MCDCQRCTYPGPPWQGKYSRKELRRLCERLKITKPVRICVRPQSDLTPDVPGGYVLGSYDTAHFYERGEHLIEIDPQQSKDSANVTLIHELTHGAQAERAASPIEGALNVLMNKALFDYEESPIEVEAQENADTLHADFKVVVA